MISYEIEFLQYETIVRFLYNSPVAVRFEGMHHQTQAMEFIRMNMVHMGQIGE